MQCHGMTLFDVWWRTFLFRGARNPVCVYQYANWKWNLLCPGVFELLRHPERTVSCATLMRVIESGNETLGSW